MPGRNDPLFSGNYGITLGCAIAALVPFIVVTSAFPFVRQQLISDLHSAPALHTAVAITLAVTVALMIAGIALYVGGGFGLRRPDLERWLGSDEPAWSSPELLALATRTPSQTTTAFHMASPGSLMGR